MPEDIAHKEFVENAFVRSLDKPDGVMFATATAEQSKVAMDAIIENTEKDLRLMAKALNRAVHDPYQILKALQNRKDLQVQVIVEMADPFNCTYSALSDLKRDPQLRKRIEVRHLSQHSPVHLSIGDTALTRIHQDKVVPTTIIAFNNREIAEQAVERFRLLWERCPLLPWPRPVKFEQAMPS
jgi:hypothetical protein